MTAINWIAKDPEPVPMNVLPKAGMIVASANRNDVWMIVQCMPGQDSWAVVRMDGTKLDFAHNDYEYLVGWLNANEMRLEQR